MVFPQKRSLLSWNYVEPTLPYYTDGRITQSSYIWGFIKSLDILQVKRKNIKKLTHHLQETMLQDFIVKINTLARNHIKIFLKQAGFVNSQLNVKFFVHIKCHQESLLLPYYFLANTLCISWFYIFYF